MKSGLRLLALVALGCAGVPGPGANVVSSHRWPASGAKRRGRDGHRVALDAGFPNADAGKGFPWGDRCARTWGRSASTPASRATILKRRTRSGPWWDGQSEALSGTAHSPLVTFRPARPVPASRRHGIGRSAHDPPLARSGGRGIALTIPNPVFAIKPWLAPRPRCRPDDAVEWDGRAVANRQNFRNQWWRGSRIPERSSCG
jgi:hypothetical protein